ncbi:MAG: radical SAM protein [Halobacteriota archaeon]
MSKVRPVPPRRDRERTSGESEPLFSALNTINVFLGNSVTRKVIRSVCSSDRTAVYDALSYYSGDNDLSIRKKLKAFPICTFVELGRLSFHVGKPKMQEFFSKQVTRRGLSNIIKSVAEYGISKPLKLQAPFLVVWNYTNACNLRCKHCYQRAGKMSQDELGLSERLAIVDQLADNDVVAVAFSGGEALLRDDFWQVAQHASDQGLYLSLATNGTLLTEDVVRRLVDVGVGYFEISLDSVDPAKHDAFRGVKGTWDRTIAGIKNVVAQGAYAGIANTITNDNYQELDALVRLSKNLGVKRTLVFNFIPVGRGAEIIDMDIPPDVREHVLQQMYGYLGEHDDGDFQILTTAPQLSRVCLMSSQTGVVSLAHFGTGGFSEAAGKVGLLSEFIGGCGAGRMYCAIQPNGIVTPCVFMPIPVGDLRSEQFIDIWRDSEVMQSLRERHDLKEHCGSCDYRNVCGGCRARAYAYFDDIKAPDIGCINNIAAYNELKEKVREVHASPEAVQSAKSL